MKRLVQRLTGIHRVHHIQYSYGWVFVPFKIGFFENAKLVKSSFDRQGNYTGEQTLFKKGFRRVKREHYHDCTITGVR